MRICLIYDCLFPWTIGGAERWYRNLGERLAADGHEVSYLTLRQWDEPPEIDGIRVVAVGPQMPLYKNGKRRLFPPLRFGLGVLLHLLRHGRRYDVVHTASFPYFSLLAAALACPLGRYRIVSDWHEVWSRDYWREYLGRLGFIGNAVQRLCAAVPQSAYTFSRMHQERLNGLGVKAVKRLTGEYASKARVNCEAVPSVPHTVVYAGRFISEKRVELLVDALAIACERVPGLHGKLIGDGPTRADVLKRLTRLQIAQLVNCPGFVTHDVLDDAMSSALCVVQPSSREGYGMVVVEAARCGVPAIVVAAPDNAATELITEGQNGFVVGRADPGLLAAAIVECEAGGADLRRRTREWYAANEKALSIETSLATVVQDYRSIMARASAQVELHA